MAGHRWSGWPGVWCLDCGCPDPLEQAIADGNTVWGYPEGVTAINPAQRHLYGSDECPEPGSRRHDPYKDVK